MSSYADAGHCLSGRTNRDNKRACKTRCPIGTMREHVGSLIRACLEWGRKMKAPYLAYWGKADPALSGYHLAVHHSLDVAAVAERMLARDPVIGRRLAAWAGLEESAVAETLALFCALHDIGKIDARFQIKAKEPALLLDPARAIVPQQTYDHGGEGFRQLYREQRDTIESALGASVWPLLQAVTGHHGDLPSYAASSRSSNFSAKAFQAIRERDREARRAFVRDLTEMFRRRGAQVPLDGEPSGPLVVALAGLCSVADWIGSQTDYFPYQSEPVPLGRYYAEQALPRADKALDALRLRSAHATSASFGELFPGYVPRDVQTVTEGLALSGTAMVIIEAQMGSGKTEAALSLAHRFIAGGTASGLYVGLPTMATSNAMFERLEKVAARMFEGDINLILAHGKRALHAGFERLLERASREPYEEDARVVCNRWLMGRKRALLGQLGVGTVDQAMQAAIRVRHHFVRAYGLAQSVVILDEIHAYDAYMEVILERLVEWLGALGSPLILLSATLPEERRAAFGRAYARGAGWGEVSAPPTRISPGEAPYPLVTVVHREGAFERGCETPSSNLAVRLRHHASESPEKDVLPRLIEAVAAGATVAWVRNTVTEAQEAWESARRLGFEPLLFHARMRARDRQRVEEEVLREFGRNRTRRGRLLIATQVVEQSLDLDFDGLVTDLCPIDLLLQRMGRLHRHERERPAGFETPEILVLSPTDEQAEDLAFGPSACIYDEATLWLTLDIIRSRRDIVLPGDIRPLVESVYDPLSRRERIESARLRERLAHAEAKLEAKLEALRAKAKMACIPPASLEPGALETYGDEEETLQALTRDGDSVSLLPILWDGEEGRPLEGGEPWNLNIDSPRAWLVARDLAEQVVNVPAYPWEKIERGSRARGEAHAWEAFCERATSFCKQKGVGALVLVPMRAHGEDGEFRGVVETAQGQRKRLSYSKERGLWFRKEKSG